MVHFVRELANYASSVKMLPIELKEKHPTFKLLFQDKEIIVLANKLLELIPVARDNITYDSKTIQKLSLASLTEKATILRLPDIHPSIATAQGELERIQVWNFECSRKDKYAVKPWTYSYLDLIFDELYKAVFIPKIRLLSCSLSTDDQNIYLTLEWHGPFTKIEPLTIPGVTYQFWNAACDTQDSALRLNVMRYLLYLQVAGAWSENKLALSEVQQDGRLTAALQLARANSSGPPSEVPLSETSWKIVSDYIVRQFYPEHLEASQKLELKLREELDRRQEFAKQGLLDSKFVDPIDVWINELVGYRDAYRAEISKTY